MLITEMLTLDLKKSNDNLIVHGKLIVYLSANVSQPFSNPVNGLTAALANMGLDDNTNLSLVAVGQCIGPDAQSSGRPGDAPSRDASFHPDADASDQPVAHGDSLERTRRRKRIDCDTSVLSGAR